MKAFMLLVCNGIDHQATWSTDRHQQFLKSCETYIEKLRKDGKLKITQPLVREGVILSGSKERWKEVPFNEIKEAEIG